MQSSFSHLFAFALLLGADGGRDLAQGAQGGGQRGKRTEEEGDPETSTLQVRQTPCFATI